MSGPHVACSDCERIRPGMVAQPVNTVSSLAFLVAAAPIWRRAAATADRPWQVVAVSAVVAGLGSVAYHGPGGRLGKALHDVGVAALAVAVAGALTTDVRVGRTASRASAVVAVTALTVHATSRSGGLLCLPDSRWQGHAAWHVLLAGALFLAAPDDAARRSRSARSLGVARSPADA